MKPHPKATREQKGAVLVTTLIVLTVLAVVAVAFMQSTSMDQLASRSVSGAYQAQLVADAAVGAARGEVARLIQRYPDSVTVWQNIGGAQTNEATVLYVRADAANTNTNARPGQFGTDVAFLAFPLLSRTNTNPLTLTSLSNTMPFSNANREMVNLNATNTSRSNAFIGERSMTNPGAPVAAADWIYIGRNPGPTNANNPPIGRYAFWVEDESFKVNVNTATNGPRGVASLGTNGGADVRIDGSWGSSANSDVASANFAAVVSDRANDASFFPTAATAAVAAGVDDAAGSSEIRFLTTTHSAGLDLSRGGFKRFNINAITNGDKRTALNRLILAITNTNAAPLFGQRFYRLANNVPGITNPTAVTINHAAIYLNKIAANIYDYIDSDDQPTVINVPTNTANFTNMSDFVLRTGRPDFGIEALGTGTDGTNSVAAFGIENGPRLQEYVIHARVRQMSPFGFNTNSPPADPKASFTIWIDHYFEFWNPGTKDVTLTNAFLKIYDQPAYGPGVTGDLANEGRPFEISISNVTFPAGRVTVLTTAPVGAINIGDTDALIPSANAGNVISVHSSAIDPHRIFTGETTDTNTGAVWSGFNRFFRVQMVPRSSGSTDYQSGVVFGNNQGILDSHVGLPIARGGANAMSMVISNQDFADAVGSLSAGNNYFVRGGSLRGNSGTSTTPSPAEGDPRALVEQLMFTNFISGGTSDGDQTRFYTSGLDDGSVPAQSTVGAPNANFVVPTRWADHSSISAGASNAPLVVRNGPMQTIGELGHITDPARPFITSGQVPERARGGGRTLRVGQPELTNASSPWYNSPNQTNASRTWTSWRLADIFTVVTNYAANPATNGVANAANVRIRGLINPNGALRDNGAALRAAIFGLTFLPAGPDGASGVAGRPLNTNAFVSNIITRLTNGNAAGFGAGTLSPFWERGELSELTVFSAPSGGVASGANMSNTFDRGREELIRRSIEMITTRGSVFTVYAIGQSLRVTTNSTNITGTVHVKSTFEMTPQFISSVGATNDAFNLGSAASVNQRFSAPTNYSTRILTTTYD